MHLYKDRYATKIKTNAFKMTNNNMLHKIIVNYPNFQSFLTEGTRY